MSRGFLCPKALALKPLHEDSQRLRHPLRKNNGRWEEIGWEAAFAEAAEKLAAIQKRYGADSVAFYTGNPNVHSYAAQLLELEFARRQGVAPAEISASMMPGVISLPHGFGHGKPATRVHIPDEFHGVSVNDLADERHLDALSGTVSLNGLKVVVRPYAELKLQESFANETAADRNSENGGPQQEAHQGSTPPL